MRRAPSALRAGARNTKDVKAVRHTLKGNNSMLAVAYALPNNRVLAYYEYQKPVQRIKTKVKVFRIEGKKLILEKVSANGRTAILHRRPIPQRPARPAPDRVLPNRPDIRSTERNTRDSMRPNSASQGELLKPLDYYSGCDECWDPHYGTFTSYECVEYDIWCLAAKCGVPCTGWCGWGWWWCAGCLLTACGYALAEDCCNWHDTTCIYCSWDYIDTV